MFPLGMRTPFGQPAASGQQKYSRKASGVTGGIIVCGRYYIAEDDQAEELRQIIDSINRKYNGDGAVKTSGEIFPSETVPVIATSKAQKSCLLQWNGATAQPMETG